MSWYTGRRAKTRDANGGAAGKAQLRMLFCVSFLRGARLCTSQICTPAVFFREWTQIIKKHMIKSDEAKEIKAGKSTRAGPGYRNSRMD